MLIRSPRGPCLSLFALVLLFTVGHTTGRAAVDDLTVFTRMPGPPSGEMMSVYLKGLAFAALDRRDAEFEKLKNVQQLESWQRSRREAFLFALGGFPDRTPLNARVTGHLASTDYRLEKLVFESQPGFFVTATLYLPLTPGPHPVVVHPTGHSANAKARDIYQRASIVLAKNGIACLCYDPVGQGERRHYFLPDGRPRFVGTSQEHRLMGVGCTLLGTNVARYMIWDGMRAVDYLQSRDDIDPARIGATGISGGGTNSSYLAALDDRIVASAPGCYLTGFRRLLETIGPQDAEQNLFGQIANGLDHGDYVMMQAPRPALIMAATRDYFDIEGAWHLFRQSKRFYTRLGFAERVDLIEPDTTHGFPTEMRVGAARWMRRWFLGSDEPITELDFAIHTEQELQCTPQGQVLHLPGARSLFDLNLEWEQRLLAGRKELWGNPAAALREVRRVTGIRALSELAEPQVETLRVIQRNGYTISQLVFEPEPGIRLPALKFKPAGREREGDPVLYVHGEGKRKVAGPGGPIEKLVLSGRTVLAVDVRGSGETGHAIPDNSYGRLIGASINDVGLAELIGKSFVSMRAEDILGCARFLAGAPSGASRPDRVALIASGETGVPALHAAALEPGLFSNLRLERTLTSWAHVLSTPMARNQNVNTVFGALRVYDLPDLVTSLPPGFLTNIDPLDAEGEPVLASQRATSRE